jgi:hypothetical protein
MTPTPLLNRSAVRDYALAILEAERPHLKDKLTRVGDEFFVQMEIALRAKIQNHIRTMSRAGATIR